MSHDTDALLRRSRFRGRGRRQPDRRRLDCGLLGFLGDDPRSGAFFLAFLLIVPVFLGVVVFLRVDALTAAFLRFALVFPVAFFRVAITASLVSSWIPVAESLPKRSKSPGKEEHDTKADIGESGREPFQKIVD